MTVMINAYEAQLQFDQLLKRVREGEQIIIAEEGQPVARLMPLQQPLPPRTPGSAAGQVVMSEDFDDPLPEAILDAFEQ